MRRFNQTFGWSLPTPPRHNKAVVDTDAIELDDETVTLAEQVQAKDMELYRLFSTQMILNS